MSQWFSVGAIVPGLAFAGLVLAVGFRPAAWWAEPAARLAVLMGLAALVLVVAAGVLESARAVRLARMRAVPIVRAHRRDVARVVASSRRRGLAVRDGR